MLDESGGSALEVFYSCAPQDEPLRRVLEKQLKLLERQRLITGWHRGLIPAGVDQQQEAEQHLKSASVILVLLSSEYVASDECYGEMEHALDRYNAGQALVVPILLRPVEFAELPVASLQPLPTGGKAVSTWSSQDKAWYDIARGIRRTLEHERAEPALASQAHTHTRLWNIPYGRNLLFTGREDLLQQLHDRLTKSRAAALTQPQAISGLGGIGKTQLAVEYAYRYRETYQAVLWVNASSREALLSSFAELATILKLPERTEPDQSRLVAAVKAWFVSQEGWLALFDNADDLELVEEFMPTGGHGHLLLTTRAQAPGLLAEPLEVEQLDEQEGMLLLLRRARVLASDAPMEQAAPADQAAAGVIVQELGGLPLALDQAGAYIEETRCSVAYYLARYRERQAALLARRGGTGRAHPDPVAATWSLSFGRVEELDPRAADLLRVCAFLAPDAIPESLLLNGASQLGERLQPLSGDAGMLDEAVSALLRFSLVKRKRDDATLSVHRLVQAVLRASLDEGTGRAWAERVVRAVGQALPDVADYHTWPRCQQCLPHADTCACLIDHYGFAFSEAARLCNEVGYYLRKRAQYPEAEAYLQRALAIGEQVLGSEHPGLATYYNNLAGLYRDQGKYTEAEPLYQRAIAIDEKALGSEHPRLALHLNNLANLYREQGKDVEAEALYQRAIAIGEKALGPDHPNLAARYNNLAGLYRKQGKYAEAELLYQRVLAIVEKSLRPEHPDLAICYNNLAFLYKTQGKYAEAEALYQRAIAIDEKTLGLEHPDLATRYNNLAFLYKTQGKYAEAEALYQRAIAILEQKFGPQHPSTLRVRANLEALQRRQTP